MSNDSSPAILTGKRSKTQEKILAATVRCCEKFGVNGLTMSEIAVHAEVGRATLYRHYASLDDILVALISREMSDLIEELNQIVESSPTLEEKLIEATIYFLREVPRSHVLRMLFSQSSQLVERMAITSRDFRALGAEFCRPIFEQALEEGRIRPGVTLDQFQEWTSRLTVSFGFNPHIHQNDPILFRQYLLNFMIPSLLVEK